MWETPDLTAALFYALNDSMPSSLTDDDFEKLAAGTPAKPRVWLIDEADVFVNADAERGYRLAWIMRSLAERGLAYFVLCGFWDVYRHAMLTVTGPLRNFGEILRLGPLGREEARSLATEPINTLRLSYETDATVDAILDETGCRANLVAIACSGIVEQLGTDERVITAAHVRHVLDEYLPLFDELKFWRGGSALDRAIVRAAALEAQPTRDSLRTRLEHAGAAPSREDFTQSLDRLELSYILVPASDGTLGFPIPLLNRFVLRGGDPERAFQQEVADLTPS
jgi:hypothetical protein